MSINSSYLNPDSSGAPYGSNSSNGSADSYSFSGGYSSYDEPASPLSSASAASATGASETGTYGAYGAASATGASTTETSASATSASSAAYNSTGTYSSTDTYEPTGSSEPTSSSNSTKDDAVWRGQSSKEPAELKRPRVSTLIASLIMLAAAAILGALAMGVHFSWTAVGASTLGTIGLVLIVSAFFANRNKSHS